MGGFEWIHVPLVNPVLTLGAAFLCRLQGGASAAFLCRLQGGASVSAAFRCRVLEAQASLPVGSFLFY